MNSEKVKEIKKALEQNDGNGIMYEVNNQKCTCKFIHHKDVLTLINELKSENQQLKDRITELEDKIENGTLIELPKTCYQVIWVLGWEILEYDIISVKYNYYDDEIEEIGAIRGNTTTCFSRGLTRPYGKIGEDVFFAKAKAEKKLKELKGEV